MKAEMPCLDNTRYPLQQLQHQRGRQVVARGCAQQEAARLRARRAVSPLSWSSSSHTRPRRPRLDVEVVDAVQAEHGGALPVVRPLL